MSSPLPVSFRIHPEDLGTAAELADKQIAHYRRAIEDGTGNPDVCRDMIDRWLDHRIDHGNEPRQPL